MTQLRAQSIHDLCAESAGQMRRWLRHPKSGQPVPMISPYTHEKVIINGLSAGLSVASYDVRIAHDLTLEPHPGFLLAEYMQLAEHPVPEALVAFHKVMRRGYHMPFQIAHTVEDFAIPLNVSAQVCDKSTRARKGLSCFNTFFDPGFIGNATLELVNLSASTIIIRSGDPIAQFIFQWLDGEAEGYDGKYQFQGKQPTPAILEGQENDHEGRTHLHHRV